MVRPTVAILYLELLSLCGKDRLRNWTVTQWIGRNRSGRNTLIIFTGDHGEFCASHHMFQKFTQYQESVRAFHRSVVRRSIWIGEGHHRRPAFLFGVDILSTVCDYAGVKVPDGVQGQSLRPLVERRETDWRSFAFIESNYWGRSIVTEGYKYVMEYQPSDDFTPPGPRTY